MVQAGTILDRMRAFPIQDCTFLLRDSAVLVLAPHPDDESLGCGGLIAACQRQHREVYVAVLTDGSGSHPGSREYPAARLAALRMAEARAAAEALGLPADHITFLGLPDGHLPAGGRALRDVAARVAERALAWRVGVVCATWLHDPHTDHQATNLIGQLVARQIGARLLSYPVWGWTLPDNAWLPAEPVRGARLDIAAVLPAKLRAIACHRSQITDLIRDDPAGFRLSADMLARFNWPFEVFVES